jgi:hypothetical protein
MQTTKATLDGTFGYKVETLEIDENAVYMVDWSKMTSVNDMILILASMAIGFPGNHPNIQQLKPFLNLQSPIKREQQPQQKEVALPKLKGIK